MPDWSLRKLRSWKKYVRIGMRVSSLNRTYHSIHEANKGPKSHGIVLHDCVERSQEVTHALYISQVRVIFIVCQEHILHLLKVHIGSCIGEWRVGVRVRDVLPSE
jgi:hypothetical protein